MARIVAVFAFVSKCGALSFERHDPVDYVDAEDVRQFSESSRSMPMKVDGEESILTVGGKFGKDAVLAEQEAWRARRAAEKAIEEDEYKSISERQMDALTRHAESAAQKEEREQKLLEKVADSMEQEADTESKAVEDVERQAEKLEGKQVRWQRGKEVEELRGADGQWIEDPAFKNEELRERSQDADFAREESQEAKALVLARKQLDSARASERMELHRRAALEQEARARLAQEADAMRREAARNGTLSEESVRRALDVSKKELGRVIGTFAHWSSDGVSGLWIEGRLEESRVKAAISSAKMLEAIKHKVATFKAQSEGYDDHQFLARLAQLLNETRAEVTGVENFDDVLMGKLRHWDEGNNETLTYTLAVALQGVTRSVEFKNHLMRMDTARLAHASTSEACALLGKMVQANLQPAYRVIELQRQSLDSLSKVAPSITAHMPDYVQTTMINRTASVLNMAFVEHLALKEAATVIAQDAVPLVLERLRCVASGAERVAAPALPALLGAAAAWLAQ